MATTYIEFIQRLHEHMSLLNYTETPDDKLNVCIQILEYILSNERMLKASNPSFDEFKTKLFKQIQKMENTDYTTKNVDATNLKMFLSLCSKFHCYY